MKKYQNKYRIPSTRALWHDYDDGLYFITICTQHREHYFGEISMAVETFHETSLPNVNQPNGDQPNGVRETCQSQKMQLSDIGRFVDEQIRQIASHYAYATIPFWVVMPNHIHLIVAIDGTKTPHKKRDITSPQQLQNMTQMQSWLSVVIRQLKSAVTYFAKQKNISFGWQTRFHDHIIRTQQSLYAHIRYVENNVMNWKTDCFQ